MHAVNKLQHRLGVQAEIIVDGASTMFIFSRVRDTKLGQPLNKDASALRITDIQYISIVSCLPTPQGNETRPMVTYYALICTRVRRS